MTPAAYKKFAGKRTGIYVSVAQLDRASAS